MSPLFKLAPYGCRTRREPAGNSDDLKASSIAKMFVARSASASPRVGPGSAASGRLPPVAPLALALRSLGCRWSVMQLGGNQN